MNEDLLNKLERLAKLKDQGMLTDSEFESQKAALLQNQQNEVKNPSSTNAPVINEGLTPKPIYKRTFFWVAMFLVFCVLVNLFNQPSEEEKRQNAIYDAAIARDAKNAENQKVKAEAALNAWKTDLVFTYKAYHKGGFGSVGLHDFTIKNKSKDRYWKDLKLQITYYGSSGTELGSQVETLYEAAVPGRTLRKYEFNAGFVNQQADKALIELVGATPL